MNIAGADGLRISRDDLHALDAKITAAQEAGWRVKGESPAALTMAYSGTDLDAGISSIRSLHEAYVSVRIVGRLDQHEIVLRLPSSGNLEIDRLPKTHPEDIFEDDLVDIGRRAWDGDAGSAARLPFTWEISAGLELAKSLPGVTDADVRVLLDATAIETELGNCKVADLRRYVPQSDRRCYIALRGDHETLHLGAVSFACLAGIPSEGLAVPSRVEPLPGERARLDTLGTLPAPSDLLPIDGQGPPRSWRRLLDNCEAAAARLTWMMTASSHELTDRALRLRFVGYKPTWLEFPDAGDLSDGQIRASLGFRRWLFCDDSPDRVLAVQHVISLYPDHAEFPAIDDIQAGAQTIYFGLRSTAVAEEVTSVREAQNHAQDAVRQTLKSTQDALKALTERFMATLVGIGGVIIGRATHVLSDDVSRLLMLLIGAFILVLALFSLAIEGPIVGLAIRDLPAQIRDGYPLLQPEQRDPIVSGESVKKTRRMVRTARFTVPISYVLLFLAILFFGYPGRYL